MPKRIFLSIFIGLIIPFVGVIAGIFIFRYEEFFIFGFPVLYFWLFLWFILTSICIACSWHFFDRHHYE